MNSPSLPCWECFATLLRRHKPWLPCWASLYRSLNWSFGVSFPASELVFFHLFYHTFFSLGILIQILFVNFIFLKALWSPLALCKLCNEVIIFLSKTLNSWNLSEIFSYSFRSLWMYNLSSYFRSSSFQHVFCTSYLSFTFIINLTCVPHSLLHCHHLKFSLFSFLEAWVTDWLIFYVHELSFLCPEKKFGC